MAIVLRTVKGLPLTYTELDNNFAELDTRINQIAGSNVASINGKSGNVYITTSDINEGTNLYYTDTRVDTRLGQKTSDFFAEGTVNLYYSNAKFDSRLALKTTDNIAEGITNIYYTTERARSAVSSAGGALSYNSTTGVFTLGTLTTTNITEGTNLYYTNTRVDARLAASSIDVLSDVDTSTASPSDNNVLTWSQAFGKWLPAPVNFSGAGLGEVNTGSNIGGGQGIFAGKAVFDLRFYTLAGGNGITIAAPVSNIISITNAQDITTTASVLFGNANVTGSLISPNLTISSGNLNIFTQSGNLNLSTTSGNTYISSARTILGTGAAAPTLTSNGAYNLTINTNQGVNSGAVTITQGANGNITLIPNGTGNVVIGNLAINDNNLISTIGNGNINIIPNGAGAILLSSDLITIGDNNLDATLTTNGGGNLTLSTNNGTNSGSIQIAQNLNGNITITTNGTGIINANANILRVGTSGTAASITTNGLGSLTLNTNGGTSSGNISITPGLNGNIFITANGAGRAVISSLAVSDLTATRIPYATTNGVLVDNANLVFSGTQLTVTGNVNATVVSAPTANISNLSITGNSISAINTNGNVILTPIGSGRAVVTGSGLTTTTLTSSGATILGTTATDTLTLNASLVSSIIPQTSNSIDIGSTTYKFKNGFFTSTLSVDSLVSSFTFTSTAPVGTAPFTVSSTTQVANLNVATAGSLINGTSNITIAPSANITISSAGIANVVSVSNTGVTVTGVINSSGTVTAPVYSSNVATGTAPFTVNSTTQVANLNAATAGTVTANSQPNITSLGNLTTASIGTITSAVTNGNVAVSPNGTGLISVTASIVPTTTSSLNLGSTGLRFLNIWGVATSALYADLAERYEADAVYEPGTVLVFGGEKEVTTSTTESDVSVAGAVSTNPAYLMNDTGQSNDTHPPIALRGKVPVKVIGKVNKGDLLVTSQTPGHAMSVGKVDKGAAVFAKSLENKITSDAGVVWAVIV